MNRALALILAVVLTGCSFVLVKGPPTTEPEPQHWPRCTEHYFWEAVDASVAALALAGMIYALRSDDEWGTVGAVVEGGIATGFGVSAIGGLGKTRRCRAARAAYERAAAQNR